MYRRDVTVGIGIAVLMWCSLLVVYAMAFRVVPDGAVLSVMGVAMALLGTLNTLSVVSLARRYHAESEAIYSEDLYFLDVIRADRRKRRGR